MSSAQRELHSLDEAASGTEAEAPFALKEQVAQRLAAHRARRNQNSDGSLTPIATPSPAKSRSSRIAATVAERYANSPSYRSFLAEQAETAIRHAEAAAEVAALSARAVADAQYELLAELDQWTLTPPTPTPAPATSAPKLQLTEAPRPTPAAVSAVSNQAVTVRLYEDASFSFAEPNASSTRLYSQTQTAAQIYAQASVDEDEALILDDEIAFRQSPVFDESTGSSIEIPANLIEFPRQLVAPRKARPRLAEGPLREDADQAPATAQLRIFEVEADQISTAPVVESTAPEWSSILLAAHPVSAAFETAEAPFLAELPPQTAALNLRVMASVVDTCIVAAALLVFIAAFAVTVGKLSVGSASFSAIPQITPQIAAIAAAGTLAVLTLLYQLLFFTFSEATPGMRYARIGLCTFSDDNPSRSAMRRRIFAVILSACPLGIGFLWALLDDDGLGWHDRISRMYQRSY
jgi:uncharacterized RDD family membrane protein YckC